MQDDTLYALSALDGSSIFEKERLCNMTAALGNLLKVALVTFSADENGSLDALLVYGNTTTHDGKDEFSICRVHHTTGEMEWKQSEQSWLEVSDISGGAGFFAISGKVEDSFHLYRYRTWVLSADGNIGNNMFLWRNGLSYPLIVREHITSLSCTNIMYIVTDMSLQARCLDVSINDVLWVSTVPCYHRPTLNKDYDLVCVNKMESVSTVDHTNGKVLWTEDIKTEFPPVIVDDLVWITGADTTLSAVTMLAGSNSPGPGVEDEGTKPMGTGEVVIIVFVVIFVGGLTAAVLVAWVRRTRRRTAYTTHATSEEDGYGSLNKE